MLFTFGLLSEEWDTYPGGSGDPYQSPEPRPQALDTLSICQTRPNLHPGIVH